MSNKPVGNVAVKKILLEKDSSMPIIESTVPQFRSNSIHASTKLPVATICIVYASNSSTWILLCGIPELQFCLEMIYHISFVWLHHDITFTKFTSGLYKKAL